MQKDSTINWYNKLKFDIISLMSEFQEIKKTIVFMLVSNKWILEDAYLSECFNHLTEMVLSSSTKTAALKKQILQTSLKLQQSLLLRSQKRRSALLL